MQRLSQQVSHALRHPRGPRRRLPVLAALLVTALALPPSYLLAGSPAAPHEVQAQEYQVHNRTTSEPRFGPDGRALLINGRTVTPAGKQSSLGDLPLNAVLSPDGSHLLVSNSGAGMQSLQVVNASTGGVVQSLLYPAPASVFVGLAYSPGGTRAYVSGGGSNVIHTFAVAPTGRIDATGDISVGASGSQNPSLGTGPWPSGLSLSPDGSTLYVADNLANAVSVLSTAGTSAPLRIPVGSFPYTTLVTPDGRFVYVSNWGDDTVSVIDTASKKVIATIRVGLPNTVAAATSHPSAMALSPEGLLYVALSNSDAIAVINPATNRLLRIISDASYPGAPLGASPEGLAVSPDGHFLYVANAGDDDVAVFALNGAQGLEQQIGRIPTGWYPTSVVVSTNGQTLYVTNGKGQGAGPNGSYLYPDPTRRNPPIIDAITGYNDGYCNCSFDRYTGSMIVGTLSTIAVPGPGLLRLYSAEVAIDNHEGDTSIDNRPAGNPIPLPGGTSPIKHVIYIIKENRTYDQVFGDKPVGDGNASLTLFGRADTPNLHALTDRFGVLDNFYADSEVSADGHNWTDSANASDYNEKMWPQDYAPGIGRNRGYDFEGGTTINLSPGGYLWDAAARAGISYRDYGEFTTNGSSYTVVPAGSPCAGPVATTYIGVTIPPGDVLCFAPSTVNPTTTPNLVGHSDPKFRTFDLAYSDLDRVAEWEREFDAFVAHNDLPQLELLRLPNDHTEGTSAGFLTPRAYVAQDDYAVGRVIDIVSHSPYWANTAIFVTEDDAQNGPDHVDAHRTESLAISPYTSRSFPFVDHTLYDTAAMVRTMELILGLAPLSQYDANAQPMVALFTSTPDMTPYTVIPPLVSITAINPPTSFGAQASAQMDFSREDRAPANELNHILWHAIKGARSPYPVALDHGNSGAHGDPD